MGPAFFGVHLPGPGYAPDAPLGRPQSEGVWSDGAAAAYFGLTGGLSRSGAWMRSRCRR